MTSVWHFSLAEKRALESSMSQDDCDCQGYKGTEVLYQNTVAEPKGFYI